MMCAVGWEAVPPRDYASGTEAWLSETKTTSMSQDGSEFGRDTAAGPGVACYPSSQGVELPRC